ncbi:MAG: hypothetical protein NVSMB47_13170 [Polyangiales bacterium]
MRFRAGIPAVSALAAVLSGACSKPSFDKGEHDHPPVPDTAEAPLKKPIELVDVDAPRGFAIDDAYVYWFESASLKKTPIGLGEATTLADDVEPGQGPVIAGNYLYWARPEGRAVRILAVAKSGGPPTKVALTDPTVRDLAGDAQGLWWLGYPDSPGADAPHDARLLHVAGPGEPVQTIAPRLKDPHDLATDGAELYWTSTSGAVIQHVSKKGGAPLAVDATAFWSPAIAVTTRWVYWLSQGDVMRVAKTGGASSVAVHEGDPPVALGGDPTGACWVTKDGEVKILADDSATPRTIARDESHVVQVASNGRTVIWETKSSIRMVPK